MNDRDAEGETAMSDRETAFTRRQCLRAGSLAFAAGLATGGLVSAGVVSTVFARSRQSRTDKLRVLTESPLNAETALANLIEDYLTPRDSFYIRTNGSVPSAHDDDHEITFEGLIDRPGKLSLLEMRRAFGEEERNAVLMCAGNRRTEMGQVKKVSGTPWTTGAIGNATWRGVSLAKVIGSLGVQRAAKHVWFESIDRCKMKSGGETAFGASIPIGKALDGTSLLAQTMNGLPLTADHGAPVRVIVPGFIGARSVKWLGKVVVSDKPSPNHFVSENYKIVADVSPQSLAAAEPIYEYTINSLICDPAPGEMVSGAEITLRGLALPRGGRFDRIAKVEILRGDNSVLCEAQLSGPGEAFCWEHWTTKVKLPRGEHTLGVRATGTQGDIQPLEPNWNAMGYLFNAPHRVTFRVG
jgi:sulfite oxidase